MSVTTMNKSIHEGRNIKRFREMLNITQEAMAADLGDDWTQKKISLLEGKEKIEPEILDQVARVLKISPEAIKNFSEEAAFNVIANTFNSNDTSTLNAINYNCSFNPLDKVIELYERLLTSEREKTDLLQGNQQKK
ncbi:helix-turn-helix transcriptional regulator [Chitinophaga sp. LS1]|uniref:helix-turn-helix transcriptional regulator n=1 Tax=Chitinophaga sp. LS1 TaxID=3051176 RepID=UPI002AAAFD32|nr:helix-turn-helix transcriptional regulator [Chitinophaga sp. LS1]WPV65923.1 helix-turn-helix transcriptional regulator [Chitinophaga sp. LS1]